MKTYPQLTNIFRLKPFTGAGFGVFWQALCNTEKTIWNYQHKHILLRELILQQKNNGNSN